MLGKVFLKGAQTMSTALAMKTQEVAAVLDRSAEQVQRYRKQGHLKATKNGRDWLFDRESVFAFARSRGIHTVEREVPQGSNFTNMRQAQEFLANQLIPEAELTIRPKQAYSKV
jgi:excisionase family DNA binding protein